ncbi:MAG TPA: hypothetical protein VEF76_12175 [Patescibacteria group bacterium]|nr:hypothetical protein [Patescibacteria group bacterium]
MENKNSSLRGKLRHAFNTAVLVGVTLVGTLGMTANAQAQTYQQPVSVTQTQQYDSSKPWLNDPAVAQRYQEQVDNIRSQSELRLRTAYMQEQQREAQLNQRNAQQIQRQIQQGQRASKGGWNLGEILVTTGNAGAAGQTYRTQLEIIRNQYRQRVFTEQQNVQRQIDRLDQTYERQYLSAERAAQVEAQRQARYNQPTTQRAATTQQSDDGIKSPQEMHDALVKAYQDATLRAAKAGKPLPDAGQFGLSKDDPAIQIKAPGK